MGGRGSRFKDITHNNNDEYFVDFGNADEDKMLSEQNELTKSLKK